MAQKDKVRSPWLWVPTLYYAEGLPYFAVMFISVVFYKRMGVSNTDIALYTSWLYLPWFLKPLWSPVVDLLRTKRFWLTTMQFIVGLAFGGIALTIPLPDFFKYTLLFFWLMAFSSATHDIAADGFYMLGLSEHHQALFVGVRNTFYRLAGITGQGVLIVLAGFIESYTGLENVNVNVSAVPQTQVGSMHPDSLTLTYDKSELRIIATPEELHIPITALSRQKADSIIAYVNNWNIVQGHTPQERQAGVARQTETRPSFWHRNIVQKLEGFIKAHFGKEVPVISGDRVGSIGIVYVHLSKQVAPGKEIAVTFGRVGGDKDIALITGNRFIFNESNWQEPAMAVLQLDAKLTDTATAIFRGRAGNIPLAWSISFITLGILFVLFFIYHRIILPYPEAGRTGSRERSAGFFKKYIETFAAFFKKDHIGIFITFLLLYRLAESQIVKLVAPFLLDTREVGGLALTTGQIGVVYGTVGVMALIIGGLLGGVAVAKQGLKFWLLPMAIAINVPDTVYLYLSYAMPTNFLIVNICVAIEQFGYGFGFTAYTLVMIYISRGEYKTIHFALTTAFMALGMMIPGMMSGWLQELIGYQHFFIWVLIATIPGFLILPFLPIAKDFGKKTSKDKS